MNKESAYRIQEHINYPQATIKIKFISDPLSKWLSLNKRNELDSIELPRELYSKVLIKNKTSKLQKPYEANYNSAVIQNHSVLYSEFNMQSRDFGYHPSKKRNLENKRLRCAISKTIDWHKKKKLYSY